MLRLSIDTSAATSKAPLRISSTLMERGPAAGATERSPDGVERHRNRRRRTERLTVDMRIVVGDELDVCQPVEQTFEGDPRLHSREMKTHARVFACGEGNVGHALAEDVELL
jgi:hypothetical protein